MSLVYIVTGEQSGDRHAADIVKGLKKEANDFTYKGITGPALQAEGVQQLISIDQLSVMGLTDVIKAIPRLLKTFFKIRNAITQENPKLVLLVDSPSFNLRLARSLRKKGYQGQIIQYISPSIWAWGAERKALMASTLNLLMTIYPFEKKHFEGTNLRVEYVGNPLANQIQHSKPNTQWRQQVGIPLNAPLISLFPGSRKGEILRNLPLMLQAATQHTQYHIAISAANPECKKLIELLLKELSITATIVPVEIAHYELMRESRAAIAKSGTVTLELALCGCPTVVIYQLTSLNRWFAKNILKVKLPWYCIVNILFENQLFPEYIVNTPSKESISRSLSTLLQDGPVRDQILQGCRKIQELLSDQKFSKNPSQLIAESIN